MKRRHRMPFGAEVIEQRGTRFRLWAPGAQRVDLEVGIEGQSRTLGMEQREAGWYELVVTDTGAGSRYAYRIDGRTTVPDPASRYNPDDVHAASEVVDPESFEWGDTDWRGRPFEEAVFYELHVGSFTERGTFAAIVERLDALKDLGVTAIELMPIADFPGTRNWGYDGVLPYAPDAQYGTPDGLKRLVQAAHQRGLMIFLDVVYNHFGPDGNYLHLYAPEFFTERHRTPWGAAINFDGERSRPVRDFFIHNALYWLEEFHFDGLRLDAVHAIADGSQPHILVELAEAVRAGPGRTRHVHLVLENDDNAASYLGRDASAHARCYDAQWNDDFHHAVHVLATGERDGYYADYAEHAVRHLGCCLTEGFAWQGEHSPYRDELRGAPSAHLPPMAFIAFLQNHDQIGNRAFGERLTVLTDEARLRAAATVLLLAPSPPLLFMGEEFGCVEPFQYFCDFSGELADAVREGRRNEFARFARFRDAATRATIPDPNDPETFRRSRPLWDARREPAHARWLAFYRELLTIRRREIIPRLRGVKGHGAEFELLGDTALKACWTLADASRLTLLANFAERPIVIAPEPGRLLNEAHADGGSLAANTLHGPAAVWYLDDAS